VFTAEAAAAGATQISISGNVIVNQGLARLSEAVAARYGLQLLRINNETLILTGPVRWP
jgi:hypothetical protein